MADATAMGRRNPLVLVLLVVAVVAAGCADDGSSYAADADAICAPVVAKYRALLRQAGGSSAARNKAVSRMIQARAAGLAELHRLTPPPEKRGKVERMLRYFDKSQSLLRKGDRSFGESEEAPFLLLFGAREGDKAQAIARELGLDDCTEL
jgi:hypothetical protein